MKMFGYGEDALTLWALTNRLGVILGELDEIAPAEAIQSRISTEARRSLVKIIPQADHFFWGKEEPLESALRGVLKGI